MVKAHLDKYYTMRVKQHEPFLEIQVMKWEEFSDSPIETYSVYPGGRPGAGMCSCPAFSLCKHARAVQGAIEDGTIDDAWKYKWVEIKHSKPVSLERVEVGDIEDRIGAL